jgi:hypothetical protein
MAPVQIEKFNCKPGRGHPNPNRAMLPGIRIIDAGVLTEDFMGTLHIHQWSLVPPACRDVLFAAAGFLNTDERKRRLLLAVPDELGE